MLACAPALWQQAVVVEVYALHVGLSAALLLVLWHWQHNSDPSGLLAGVMFGLGLSNHLTTIWLLPAVLAAMPCPRSCCGPAAFLGGLLVGLSPYLALAVAATGAAPVNWAAPGTVRSLLWLVSGELYRGPRAGCAIELLAGAAGSLGGRALAQPAAVGPGRGGVGFCCIVQHTATPGYILAWLAFIAARAGVGVELQHQRFAAELAARTGRCWL